MLEFLVANLSTIVVGSIVFALVGLSVRATVRDLRSGKCSGCSGCSHCGSGGSCHGCGGCH